MAHSILWAKAGVVFADDVLPGCPGVLCSGVVGVCLVGVAAGAGPGEGVVGAGGDGPAGVGFESVVVSAQGVEVVGGGCSGGPGGGVVARQT